MKENIPQCEISHDVGDCPHAEIKCEKRGYFEHNEENYCSKLSVKQATSKRVPELLALLISKNEATVRAVTLFQDETPM